MNAQKIEFLSEVTFIINVLGYIWIDEMEQNEIE